MRKTSKEEGKEAKEGDREGKKQVKTRQIKKKSFKENGKRDKQGNKSRPRYIALAGRKKKL